MANEIDRLEIQVQTEAQRANAELDKLVGKLEKVSSSIGKINHAGLSEFSSGIDRLGESMQRINAVKTADFTRLAKNIEKLGSINQDGINNTASAIHRISNALTATSNLSDGAVKITELASSISKLGLKSTGTAITNIPILAKSLEELMTTLSKAPVVSERVIRMTEALTALTQQGSRIGSTAKGLNTAFTGYEKTMQRASVSTKQFTFSLAGLYAKIWAVKRAITGLWSSVESSMNFTETINLFQTSFKKIGVDTAEELGLEMGSVASEQFGKAFIDRAQNFNNRITDSLTLDPNLMMNYQAVFAQMANSMNLTAESALNISDSMTLLGNDIASLWNIDTDNAMKKLQSGLAGQIRPLRELGVDISKTSLEMYALKYGIEDSVEQMSQAAKVQLRWLAIMEQTEVAFGDMAKTIDSPANQLRILRQQWINLSRSIGNVFLPIITTILPYINGVVIALRGMIDTFATALGFELPDYSDTNIYRDVAGEIEGVGEEADGAAEFVDKLKKSLLGIDDLNILNSGTKIGTGKIDLNLGDGYDELDDAINKKTVSYMSKFNEELAKMNNTAKEIANDIRPKLEGFFKTMNDISPLLIGVASSVGAAKITTFFSGLASKIGAFALTPGGKVAIAVGAIAFLVAAIVKHNKELAANDLAERFGKISMSLEELKEIAEEITSNDYTAKINVYVSEKQKLSELEGKIQTDIEKLNKLNWKVSVGLQLTESEVADYKVAIESFVANMDEYIVQQQYVASLAVDVVIQDGSFKTEMTELVNRYFDGSKGEMERLGKELRSEMDKAIADGILDAEEQKVINNLMKEMAEVQNRISDAKFVAKLQTIELEGDLTAENYTELFKQIQSQIEERSRKADEMSVELLTVVNAQYEIDMKNATTPSQKAEIKRKYDEDIKGIQANLTQSKINISSVGMEFAYDKITQKWQPEMDKLYGASKNSVQIALEEGFEFGAYGVDPYSDFQALLGRSVRAFETAYLDSGMDKAARKNLENFLNNLKPTEQDDLKLAESALETGDIIPEKIIERLTDSQTLRSLQGAEDGMFFVLGQQLANSPEILKMIKNGELTAEGIPNSMILGMKSKIPDLKRQGDALVFDTDKAIKTASENSAQKNMPAYSGGMAKSFADGFAKDTTAVAAVKGLLQRVNDAVATWKVPQVNIPTAFEIMNDTKYSQPWNMGTLPIKGYATGGMPNTGEVFMSRENGIPEMVGRIGNSTAVANNDQITTGIASAVKGAIVEALLPVLMSKSSNGDTVVNIDGKEVFRATQKYANEYYAMTRRSPYPV